jgi:hypothetical protein
MRALVGELEARAGEFVTELERIEEEHRRELTDFSEELKGHQGEFAKYRETVATEVETERGEWRDEWSKQFELFTEQLKLRAAVSQWSDRAEDHEKAFKRTRRWAIGLGAVGLLCSALVFTGALEFAGWLFSSVLSADPQATAGGLRPTWQEELIFATSTSLLYLTLFLWGMRILVRTLMTEHHLGIDARGRASMAHTYLALIEKDAATDADRAIVLASLFRPVADGLVKQDDALPAVTPATILSGHLAAAAGR